LYFREKPVREHLKQVYGCLAVTMITAAVGAWVYMTVFQLGLLAVLGSLGCIFGLHMTPHTRDNFAKRMGMLGAFAFFSGMSLGPLLDMAIRIEPR
jgi:FtsH-binding integral membrane protein